MEQDNVYKLVTQPGTGTNRGVVLKLDTGDVNWWTLNLSYAGAQTRLKMFQCPSDTLYEPVTTGVFLYLYSENGGFPNQVRLAPGDEQLGRTNYAGVAGTGGKFFFTFPAPNPLGLAPAPEMGTYEGVMANRSQVTLGQLTVQDGTSNTLMFGEGLGGTGVGNRNTAWTWFGIGGFGTGLGLGRGNTNAITAGGADWWRFSSRHPAVAQFCFGDCSTRGVRFGTTAWLGPPLPATADWSLLQQMAGRKDGYNSDLASIIE
jgi:hypothetical protein